MNENEVIIKLGGEGVSVVLYGFRTERGWSFTVEMEDYLGQLFDEGGESIEEKSLIVDTLEAALELLDVYRWPRLFPMSVHPEFRQKIWDALQERLQTTKILPRQLRRWRVLCGVMLCPRTT